MAKKAQMHTKLTNNKSVAMNVEKSIYDLRVVFSISRGKGKKNWKVVKVIGTKRSNDICL